MGLNISLRLVFKEWVWKSYILHTEIVKYVQEHEVWLMHITLGPNIMPAILLVSIMFGANVTMHNNPSKPFKYKSVKIPRFYNNYDNFNAKQMNFTRIS